MHAAFSFSFSLSCTVARHERRKSSNAKQSEATPIISAPLPPTLFSLSPSPRAPLASIIPPTAPMASSVSDPPLLPAVLFLLLSAAPFLAFSSEPLNAEGIRILTHLLALFIAVVVDYFNHPRVHVQ